MLLINFWSLSKRLKPLLVKRTQFPVTITNGKKGQHLLSNLLEVAFAVSVILTNIGTEMTCLFIINFKTNNCTDGSTLEILNAVANHTRKLTCNFYHLKKLCIVIFLLNNLYLPLFHHDKITKSSKTDTGYNCVWVAVALPKGFSCQFSGFLKRLVTVLSIHYSTGQITEEN